MALGCGTTFLDQLTAIPRQWGQLGERGNHRLLCSEVSSCLSSADYTDLLGARYKTKIERKTGLASEFSEPIRARHRSLGQASEIGLGLHHDRS